MTRRRGGRARSGGRRGGKGKGSGLMSAMRGGFRSAVKGVTGDARETGSPGRQRIMNLLTIALAVAAVVLLLRRFGVLR